MLEELRIDFWISPKNLFLILRSNARRTKNRFLGEIQNTQQNLNYLKDLESWGTVEIIDSNDSFIKYALI